MSKIELIAEFGQSHGGSLERALAQVDATADAGWTYYKTQLFDPDRLCGPSAKRYWATRLGGSDSQADTFKANGALSVEELRVVKAHCESRGVGFLATPFDLEAVDVLEDLGVRAYKVASADVTYHALLRRVARTGRPVYMSTGGCRLGEVVRALDVLGESQVTLLACTLSYPTQMEDANLRRLQTLVRLNVPRVGYSDHTTVLEMGLAAVCAGARVLERHCTLGSSHVPDDQMALPAVRMEAYADLARAGYAMLGERHFAVAPAEAPAREQARRSAHVNRGVLRGEPLTPLNVDWRRPGPGTDGFGADEEDCVYGHPAGRDLPVGHRLVGSDLV